MGTISDKLMRIINTKEDIRQALISKGYDVPTSIPFKEYAKMILDLPCNADSFPDIEGIVARYSASGLTNEQMAANPVWVDKTGNGRDLQLKNFSWKRMSGVGGYVQDFNDFRNNATVDKIRIDEQGSNSIKVTILTTGIGNAIYIPKNIYQFNKSYFIKISSEGYDEGDMALSFYAPSTSTATTVTVSLNPNGITEIPAIKEDDFLAVYINVSGKVGSFTVEQLPLYPGALVFDGVDDYGVCDNFPILTKEKGYTVVALRQYITRNEGPLGLVSNIENWFKDGAFLLEFREIAVNQFNRPISFGAVGKERDLPCVLTYQTSKSYNGVSIEAGNFTGTDVLHVGKLSPKLAGYCNAAIWELVFLDHDATEEELTKIKDYFVKTYPWLFPDQAWTVVGKTNEDEDRATIPNITGNGNNLKLSNFGFAENSGYGDYIQNFSFFRSVNLTIWSIENTYKQVKLTCLNDSVNNTSLAYWGSNEKSSYSNKKWRLYLEVSNPDIEVNLKFNGPNWEVIKSIVLKPGINEIPALSPSEFDSLGKMLSLSISKNAVLGDWVLIQQIPEYEGYLVTDGVDDKITSSAFEMGKDFTIVGDWKFIDNKKSGTGLVKASSFYIYNTMIGLDLYINSGSVTNSLDGIKSINAACSDGRAYDRNWNEILANTGNVVGSGGMLEVSSSGGRFDRIAFKNLSIYPRILSKDDCIKAYNYLQTLKSK